MNGLGAINRYKIFIVRALPVTKQVSFPKSKKKRIRKKWRGNSKYKKTVMEYPIKEEEVIIDNIHSVMYIHPKDEHTVKIIQQNEGQWIDNHPHREKSWMYEHYVNQPPIHNLTTTA